MHVDWSIVKSHPLMRRESLVEPGNRSHCNLPHVIAMVGLPARGKTYIAKKLTRYLNWIGMITRVFNVGEYRRQATEAYKNHNFFDPNNTEALAIRNKCALDALEDMCQWLEHEGEVAVYDATNTTFERRKLIYDIVCEKFGCKLFFIESLCDDMSIIEANLKEVKVKSPDYKNRDVDEALEDFIARIEHYKKVYEPLNEKVENKYSFMQIYDAGQKVFVHRHEGHIQSRIAYYLMNIHINPRSIYFTRHGESMFNALGKVGGDSELSERGWELTCLASFLMIVDLYCISHQGLRLLFWLTKLRQRVTRGQLLTFQAIKYAKMLSKYIKEQKIPRLRIWTSLLTRTVQTASEINAPQERWKALNEIDAGVCEEMTYEEIKEKYPHEFAAREENKFKYRYPRGESYEDLVSRLEPVIMELERQENVLVVAHQAVLRCLLAYFLDKKSVEIPHIKVPLHTILKLTRAAYGCEIQEIRVPVDAVDDHQLL